MLVQETTVSHQNLIQAAWGQSKQVTGWERKLTLNKRQEYNLQQRFSRSRLHSCSVTSATGPSENHLVCLLKWQVPGPHSRHTELETIAKGMEVYIFKRSAVDASYDQIVLDITDLEH